MTNMTNLLKETKDILKENGKKLTDIKFVQGSNFGISIDKFLELADTEYECGYGSSKVAEDLIIIGNNWWIERHEYDGSEWWEYKEPPKPLPINDDNIYALTVHQSKENLVGWETLNSINGINGIC